MRCPAHTSCYTPVLTFLGQDEDSLGGLQEFLLSCAALITRCVLSTGLMISATRAGLVCFSEPQLFQLCFRADGHSPVTPPFKSKVAACGSAVAGLNTNLGSAPRSGLGQVCPKSTPQLGPSCRTRQGIVRPLEDSRSTCFLLCADPWVPVALLPGCLMLGQEIGDKNIHLSDCL